MPTKNRFKIHLQGSVSLLFSYNVHLFVRLLGPLDSKCSNDVHNYAVSRLWNKALGKDCQVNNFIADAIKLSHMSQTNGPCSVLLLG